MSSRQIFLAGASRGVGWEIAHQLLAEGNPIVALLRSEARRSELEAMGVQVRMGDALNPVEVQQAMSELNPEDVVISTIGGLPQGDQPRPDYLGNRNLIDGAIAVGVKRFILVSSIGAGNSAVALPPQAMAALGAVLAEKEKAEQHLVNSGLRYTIIRPGGLKSEPATGNGILTADPRISGTIHRADVANLVVRCLNSERSNDQILSAVDRQMLRGDLHFEEFLLT